MALSLLFCYYFTWSWDSCAQKLIYHFIKYTPVICFNNFLQSPVNVSRQEDKNPNSTIVAEGMNLLENRSYGYQFMDRSHHSVTTYMDDEETHAAINKKMFKKLGHINDQVYDVEPAKSEIEHKEPIIVGFFILQYANLRMLDFYYNIPKIFCDTDMYEEM